MIKKKMVKLMMILFLFYQTEVAGFKQAPIMKIISFNKKNFNLCGSVR